MTDYLIALASYLTSDDSPEECMLLSDLDGFLHGVACTPDPIENWLDVAMGGSGDVPEEVVGLIERRLSEVRDRLSARTLAIEPVFWRAPEGHSIAMDWCEGFMEAVKLSPEKWEAYSQSNEGGKLMLPILVHMFDDNGNPLFELAQEDIDETLDAAAEAIPTTLPAIYRGIRVLTRQ